VYFNEILLGAIFTGQVGAVKTKFPAKGLTTQSDRKERLKSGDQNPL